jgi:3-hydroxy acid dehydrogenase/malonic semialdehyde reductase
MACTHVCDLFVSPVIVYLLTEPLVTAEDIAEEVAWAAARPPHVNIAEVYVLPVNQASPTLTYRGESK